MTATTTTTRPRPNRTRPTQARPEPVVPVLEDDENDPDNGEPAGWPAWTDRQRYTTARRVL